MGKATILICHMCGKWDSDESPVRSIPVIGARFELCQKDRVNILVGLKVPPLAAARYVEAQDRHQVGDGKGSYLSTFIKQAEAETRAAAKNADVPVSENDEPPADQGESKTESSGEGDNSEPALSLANSEGDTEKAPAPSRRRGSKTT